MGNQAVPVGRLAPSPTGLLHLGHARTFLLAWWHIRARGGKVLLRMEDLDVQRAGSHFADAALRDLEWLGLDWDGPVRFQSQNQSLYAERAAELVAQGLAYPCTCTRGDLRLLEPPEEGQEQRYPGTCRHRYRDVADAKRQGKGTGLRFKVDAGLVAFRDGIFGPQTQDVAATVGDFLIRRRDGTTAYQLSVVADDIDQGVTEVFRGADLLPSTARQSLLLDAFGAASPRWFHASLVTDSTGKKLAKRFDALGLGTLRDAGVQPEQIVTWVLRSTGCQVEELVNASEGTTLIDFQHLSTAPVLFDPSDLPKGGRQ